LNVFPFLHFFETVVYLYLAVFIIIKNPKALVNRLCAAVVISMAAWSAPMIFIHNPYVSKSTAIFAVHLNALGWCTFSSFVLWFMMVFTGKKNILGKKWFYLVLFVPPLWFLYKQWTGFLLMDVTLQFHGWRSLWSASIWPHLYYVYYGSFMAVALYINFRFIRKTSNPVLKKQASIMLTSLSVCLVLGSVTDVILPLAGVHQVPNLGNTIALIWAVAVVYAITRYKFLTVTPATAADNIISTMYDCLILLDTKGEILTANKATSDLLGYTEGQLKGKPLAYLFGKTGKAGGLFEDILGAGNLKNKDVAFETKEGKEIPVLFSNSILKDQSGAPAGIVCVGKDITERKKLQEEILKSKKLESIGFLAGGIAHDFNNLLGIILGNLNLLQEEIKPVDGARRKLANAEESVLKAVELAGKFITLSTGGWMEKGKVKFSHILNNVMDSKFPGKDIHGPCDIRIAGDLEPIHGDETALEQVLQSVLQNALEAVEAMPANENPLISIRAENIVVDRAGETKGRDTLHLKEGKYVKIQVEDNGVGIPAGVIDKVFEPYFSTKDQFTQKGMGLGLSLCYAIVRKHEGHIEIQSEEGKGTVVTFYLPVFPAGY
jgi:PAS domain S-box-containing protein